MSSEQVAILIRTTSTNWTTQAPARGNPGETAQGVWKLIQSGVALHAGVTQTGGQVGEPAWVLLNPEHVVHVVEPER
jgi:hypothetical protein